MQRLKASSQLEWRDFEKHALCSLFVRCFGRHAFEIAKLPRHIHSVGSAHCVLALLIKHILPVKHIFPYCHKLQEHALNNQFLW